MWGDVVQIRTTRGRQSAHESRSVRGSRPERPSVGHAARRLQIPSTIQTSELSGQPRELAGKLQQCHTIVVGGVAERHIEKMNTQNLPLDKHLLLQFKSGLQEQHCALLDTIEKGEEEIR